MVSPNPSRAELNAVVNAAPAVPVPFREPARAVHRFGDSEIATNESRPVIRLDRHAAHLSLAALSLGSMLLLSGCAGNVEGKMLHAPETFTGETTGSIAGNGSITLVSNRGTRCEGPYRQVPNDTAGEVGADQSENGVAMLTCSDGRTGRVMFTVGADQAVGTGMLGKDIVTLQIAEWGL